MFGNRDASGLWFKTGIISLRLTVCYFQGIQYLVDNDLLEWKPEAVAEFLYKEEGLNKTAIGNFLGERYDDGDIFVANAACGSDIEKQIFLSCIHREEIHLQILQAFVHLHEFSNLNLVQALR